MGHSPKYGILFVLGGNHGEFLEYYDHDKVAN